MKLNTNTSVLQTKILEYSVFENSLHFTESIDRKNSEKMTVTKSVPNLIFGRPCNTYKFETIKKILNALGHRKVPGTPQTRKREGLLEKLQSAEKDLTEIERCSIQYLLKTNSAITQSGFIEEVNKMVKSKPVLECQICAEVKPSTCFHTGKISPSCNHLSPVCTTCLKAYINLQLKNKNWQAINCLVCSSTLPTDTVRLYTTTQVFERKVIFNSFQAA